MLIKALFLCVFAIFGSAASINAADAVLDSASVVKIFVTSNPMDFYRPWQSHGIQSTSGSGVIIDDNLILTNAHVISHHTFIQVKKDSYPKKYTAEVVAVCKDCDLALLTVRDDSFFQDVEVFPLGKLPRLQESVTVLGYPQGGEKLSITKGVVSRIELSSYAQSGRKLLAVQIDAAINPGNSGGPVIQDGKMVGIAMQVLQSGQNIGYMIPVPIIEHFFEDLQDGVYDGFPVLGISYFNTENPSLREFYQLGEREGGVLVTHLLPHSPSEGKLQKGDVIFQLDGVPVAEDGTFPFRGNERLGLPHLISQHHIGDEILVDIIRDGNPQQITLTLADFDPLVPRPQSFERPPYYIFGGMVFTALSMDLISSWGERWWEKAPLDLNYYIIGRGRLNLEEQERVVILLNVLPDDTNAGYHGIRNAVIHKVNGESFRSFREFIHLVEKNKTEPYSIFETHDSSEIILSNENIDQTNEKILRRNHIPRAYSENLQQWLEKSEP